MGRSTFAAWVGCCRVQRSAAPADRPGQPVGRAVGGGRPDHAADPGLTVAAAGTLQRARRCRGSRNTPPRAGDLNSGRRHFLADVAPDGSRRIVWMIIGMIKHGCGERPAHMADRSAQQACWAEKCVAAGGAMRAESYAWLTFRAPTMNCSLQCPVRWPDCWTTEMRVPRLRSSWTASPWWTSGAGSLTRTARSRGSETRSRMSGRSPRR